MKKTQFTALLLALLLCFTACSAPVTETTVPETTIPETTVPETTVPETTVPETTAPALPAPSIGYYTLVTVTRDSLSLSSDEASRLGCWLHFREDSTGTWTYSGNSTEFRWEGQHILLSSGDSIPFSMDGGTLTLHNASDWIFLYSGTEEPEEPKRSFRYGCYAAGSVGTADGNVTFFDTVEKANGYLILNEDGTGYLCYDGKEGEITWDDTLIRLGDMVFKYLYYDENYNSGGEPSILMGFPDTGTTVLFHPVEE